MTYQPEFHEIAAENPKLSTGGRYSPSECRARYRVAIIIPLRGRETQLRSLLSHMHPIWQRQQIEYTVYLVTQSGNDLFNRGKLMNVGFVEANKDRKFDCYVFHDVDIFLENDKCSYWCPRNKSEVVHISAFLDKNHYALKYYSIGCFPSEYPSNITYNFGGVTILTHDQFINVNGFSNIFWGWGGEDDDMALRVWKEGYAIRRDPECLTQMWKHDKAKTNETNFLRRRIHDSAFKRQHHEGLNNLNAMLPAVVEKIAFTSDVMEETRLKPWWERLRSHCVGTMIITALLIQYFDIRADGIHCVPSNQSISLSSAGSIYVNFFCYHQLPWHERYIGSITTAFSLLIYLCYSIWLMIPLVRSKFDILRNADNILRDVNHLPEKVEYLALCSPFDSCEIRGETKKEAGIEVKEKIRKFCWDFWEKSSGKKLSIYYLIRNVAAMLLMILPSYSTICFLLLSKDTFHCKNKELANLGYDFKCLNDIRSTILPYFVVFGIAMIIQFFGSAILVVLSLFMMRRNKFFLIFGNHSNKLHPMTVKFLEYKTKTLLSVMENYLPEAVKKWDINYLKLYLKIAESGERYREAYEHVQRTVKDHINNDSFKHRSVLPCVHHSSLALFCFEQKMFGLFVKIHSVAILTLGLQQDYKSHECGCNFLEFDLSKEAKAPFTDITLAQYLLNVQQDPTVIKHVFYWAKKNSYEKFDFIKTHVKGAICTGYAKHDNYTIELMDRLLLKVCDELGGLT